MKKTALTALIFCLLLFAACGKKGESAKNMEQLQKEQGIPVRVATVETGTFTQELAYNAVLGGLEESTAQAMVSDIVTSVNARIGDRVNAGQLIMTFPTGTPAAQFEQATTAFNAARQAFTRMQNLYAAGAISLQDLDNAETGFKVAKANLDASDKMINIRAPIDGVVTNIMVSKGVKTWPGQDLFTVSTTNGFKAKLMIPDSEIKAVKAGTPATASWGEETLSGRVSRVSLALDPNTRAVPVEVTFSGYNPRISFGSTAAVKLLTLTKPGVIVVPREHIVTENDKKYVWLNIANRAQRREIFTGLDNRLEYEVTEGLAAGESLIVEGLNLLTENALIKVVN